MLNILGPQFLVLHIPLQGIHFRDGVADGGAGHKIHAPAILLALQIAALDEEIQRLCAAGDVPQA